MDQFKLHAPFQPTGDQPEAIAALTQGLLDGDRFQSLLGVTGSGKTFTMANIIANVNRPTLVLAHNKTLAAQLCTEFKEFFPENAVEYFVSTTRSTACATRPQRRCQSGETSSSSPVSHASILSVTRSTTAAWSSACAPECRCRARS